MHPCPKCEYNLTGLPHVHRWPRVTEVRESWVTGALYIVDPGGKKRLVCPAREFPAIGFGRCAAEEIRRLQALYASPPWPQALGADKPCTPDSNRRSAFTRV